MLDLRNDLQRLAAATAITSCVPCRLYANKYGVLNFIGEMPMALSLKYEWEEHFKLYHADIMEIDDNTKLSEKFLNPDFTPLLPINEHKPWSSESPS